ncbi:MAG: hypothetical protein Q9168_004695 [Polycauliona sp. 1 TL-2023]
MASTASAQPVDALEPTLALVLKETGKFFRATQSNNTRQIGVARIALSQTIPSANLRFHDALDDLETEIIRAKSVFERDLSTIRTKRAERERAAAGLLKTRSPGRVVKGVKSNASSSKAGAPVAPGLGTQEALEKPPPTAKGDVKDEPQTIEPESVAVPTTVTNNINVTGDTVKPEPFSIPDSLPQDPNEPKGLAISLDQTQSTSAPAHPPKTDQERSNGPDDVSLQSDAVPPNLSSADFESMFEDSELPGASDEINFDLAFPGDNANDPTGLMDASAFENIPVANAENAEVPNLPNLGSADEDLTTLLPGLENYVNDSNDFQLSDMPGANLFDSNKNGNSLKADDDKPSFANQGDGNSHDMPLFNQPIIESSFEDMFGLDSYMNGTGDDELGGTGDFDEDWFKTDAL